MKDNELQTALITRVAAEVIEKMPAEERDSVLRQAVSNHLRDLSLTYEAKRVIEKHAEKRMAEILLEPHFQVEIERRARAAVDEVLPMVQAAMVLAFTEMFGGVDKYHHPKVYDHLQSLVQKKIAEEKKEVKEQE